MLPLVFVQALGLDVEERLRVERDPRPPVDERGQVALCGQLHLPPLPAEPRIVGQRLELAELVQAAQPSIADAAGDQRGERRGANRHEAPRRHAVGDVAEFLGPQLREVAQHRLHEQFGMQPRHAVHAVAPHRREVGHADIALARLVDDRQTRHSGVVARICRADVGEEARIDLVDDLEVAREDPAEEVHRPCLQRLGQQRVIRVRKGVPRDVPRGVPAHLVPVHQKAHQLGDGDRRMRVVELHRPLFVELLEGPLQRHLQPNHVLQRAGDEEVLLLQPKRLALGYFVVWIEHLGDVLRVHLVFDGAVVVAMVEGVEIERLDRFRLPQAQVVACADSVPEDRRVVGHALDHRLGNPAHAVPAFMVGPRFRAAAELHVVGDLGPDNLPGIAEAKPLVGDLHLPAVPDRLVEDAELVADAVADRRHFERRERVHVARGQATQAAVAEAGFLFLLDQFVEAQAKVRDRLTRRLDDAEVQQIVRQMGPGQILRREIRDDPRVTLVVRLEGADAASKHAVADGQCECGVRIVARRGLRQAGEAAEQVVEERLFQIRDGHAAARTGRQREVTRVRPQSSRRRRHGGSPLRS